MFVYPVAGEMPGAHRTAEEWRAHPACGLSDCGL